MKKQLQKLSSILLTLVMLLSLLPTTALAADCQRRHCFARRSLYSGYRGYCHRRS